MCTAVGGGFGGVDWSEVEEQVPAVSGSYGRMHEMQDEGVNKAFEGCFGVGASVKGVYNLPAILEKQERWRNVAEPLHFYHGDHLGSAAYLTDRDGHVVQTLAYLPYGEDWVEQNGLGDTSRLGMYRYNGKERDGESGYHYYGARYYWSELWNGWLSVDPMVDKYPGVSPYAYCVWNPVVLVDPEGMDTIKIYLDNGTIEQKKADGNHNVFYYNAGGIVGSYQIEGGNDRCRFRNFSLNYEYTEGGNRVSCRTVHLLCSNSDIGEQIFKKLANMGSTMEWDYYSIKNGDVYAGDLSSSGFMNKMIHPMEMYTSENVGFWDHYHPNNNSDSFYPSYSDQDNAKKLNGVRCTIFCNGLSFDYQMYVPSHKYGYIDMSKFRKLWNQFAR